MDGQETKIDNVVTNADGEIVSQYGSAEGKETTSSHVIESETKTEIISSETSIETSAPEIVSEETKTTIDETTVSDSESESTPLDVSNSYDGVKVELSPGKKKIESIPVDISKYLPKITEGTVENTDTDGKVTSVTNRQYTLDTDGNQTGYVVTTTYPEEPGRTTVETVVYTRLKTCN